MQPLSPEALVRWCQQTLPEDPRAFEQLMAQYKGYVFTIALRIMGNHEDAEDQAQEVFVKMYTSIQTLDAPATLRAWIARITINTCLNTLKRQRRIRMDSFTQFEDGADDVRLTTHELRVLPEATVLAQELRACLDDTLTHLNDAERTILVLRDIEGYSYQEISDMLQSSLGAIKMRIQRTRLVFQRMFHQLCPGLWHDTAPDERRAVPTR